MKQSVNTLRISVSEVVGFGESKPKPTFAYKHVWIEDRICFVQTLVWTPINANAPSLEQQLNSITATAF